MNTSGFGHKFDGSEGGFLYLLERLEALPDRLSERCVAGDLCLRPASAATTSISPVPLP